jgi:hypothetical protein
VGIISGACLQPCTPRLLLPPHLGVGSGRGLLCLCRAGAPASRSHPWGGQGRGKRKGAPRLRDPNPGRATWNIHPGQGRGGVGEERWGQKARVKAGSGAGVMAEGHAGTHSLRKVLTTMAAPWGTTCSAVASALWPCSCRKRQAEPTATRSHFPENWEQARRSRTHSGWGSLAHSAKVSQFLPRHYLAATCPIFYLLSVKIGLGLDGAYEGPRSRGLPRPLAQRAGRCKEQGEEQCSPRRQHGGRVSVVT